MIYRSTRPHVAELGQFEDTQEFRNVNRFENLRERPDVLILRYDAQLYFANANHFKETIKTATERKNDTKLLILNAESINSMDSTGIATLQEVVTDLRENDIAIYLTGVIGPVRDILYKTGLMQEIGEENFFLDIPYALDFYDRKVAGDQPKKRKYATQSFHRAKV